MDLKAGRGRLQTRVGPLCATGMIHISSVSKRYFRDALRKYLFLMQNSRSMFHEHIKARASSFINSKVAVTVINGGCRKRLFGTALKASHPAFQFTFLPWKHVFVAVFCAVTKSIIELRSSKFFLFFFLSAVQG